MKNTFKRSISLLLSLALAFSLMTVGASAEEFADMPNGWSREAVASAVENGLLRGNNGKLDPTGLLTRAQLATVIVRAFGATAEADLSAFTDVKADSWYYSALAKAKGMAVMNGTSDSTMSPDRPISRQEVFVLLARALKLADGKAETLNAYKDAGNVGAWAVGGTAAMVSAGYVSGSDGYLLPTANITREQFAQILYNIFSTYYQTAGVYTNDVNGSLLVNTPDVVIKDAKIAGDLVVGDGVGEGELTLENVSIGGRLVVRGGGVNSIHIKGSAIRSVIVCKENGAVRVVTDDSSEVEQVEINDGKDDVIIEGTFDSITIVTDSVPVILKNATVDTLQVNGDNAEISLVGSTKVSTLDVAEDTEGVKLDKEKSTTVGTLNTESNITVTGDGKISNITGSGKPTNEKGDEVKPATKPTGSGSSGGGGHSHRYASEWTTNETHHWHAATCEHTDQKSEYAAHDYTTVISDTATCTDAGTRVVKCVCGKTIEQDSPAKGHSYAEAWSKDENTHWHASTCGHNVKDGEAPHDWNDGVVTTPAGCTDAGVKTYTCTTCEQTKTEPITATGHSYAEAWSKNETHHWHAATCSHTDQKSGYVEHTYDESTNVCVCGAVKPSTPSTPDTPQQLSAIKGLSFDSKNGQLKLTIEKPDDETGIKRYEVYLSKDGGTTWACSAGSINVGKDWTYLLGSELQHGTYNKIKVVSTTEKDSNYTAKELVVDCSITVTVSTDSAATATFTSTGDGSYTVAIEGLSYEENKDKWYEIAYVDNVESPTSRGSSCTYMSSATAEKTAKAKQYEGYYRIREYSDVTVNEMTATVNVKETEWRKCNPNS